MILAELELDLDVFSGPFDLLLTLVLREEVDLRELSLVEVVVAYLDHLEARGELDLEATTEFIVLIAALLELKSRLLLGGDELEELLELEPGEAAEELLERMLDARRYRSAAAHLSELLAAEPAVRFREAPLPAHLRRSSLEEVEGQIWQPDTLARAIGGLLARPPKLDFSHISVARVSVGERVAHLRALLRSAVALSFDDAVRDADRMTVAVTLWALLEMHKRGEASWDQHEPFGEITVRRVGHGAVEETAAGERSRVSQLARIIEGLLFLANEPLGVAELAEATGASAEAVAAALGELAAEYEPGRHGLLLRELAGGHTLVSDPLAEDAARALLAKPRLATLTPAQLETLAIVAYLAPVSRPEIARIRGVNADSPVASLLDRSLIEESGRSEFGAVTYRTTTLFLKLFGLQSHEELPDLAQWDPTPEEAASLRERLLAAGEARAGVAPAA